MIRSITLRRQRGFTLIEAMVATLVLTVGSLGLLKLLVTSAEGMAVADRMTQAAVLARAKVNDLARVPYDTLATGAEATNIDNLGVAGGAYGYASGAAGYARAWTVTVPDVSIEYKQIQVDVRWYDYPAKKSRHVTLFGGKSRQ